MLARWSSGLVTAAASRWRMLLLVVGVFVVLSGFAYEVNYVNIPYQDPPPELAASQAHHQLVAGRIVLIGSVMTLVGVLSAVVVRVLRSWRSRRAPTAD